MKVQSRSIVFVQHFTLEYWLEDGWYVGRLKEIPGVFSQGETLAELEENVRDAYQMMFGEPTGLPAQMEL